MSTPMQQDPQQAGDWWNFNPWQVVTLKNFLFDAWPMSGDAALLLMRNHTEEPPFTAGEQFGYRQWGEWRVESVQSAYKPRFLVIRRVSGEAKESGEPREVPAVVALHQATGNIVAVTFPEWGGSRAPHPDDFARLYRGRWPRPGVIVVRATLSYSLPASEAPQGAPTPDTSQEETRG